MLSRDIQRDSWQEKRESSEVLMEKIPIKIFTDKYRFPNNRKSLEKYHFSIFINHLVIILALTFDAHFQFLKQTHRRGYQS